MSETYTNLLQWSVVLAFFVLVAGFMFAEAFWISRKGWANFGKAFVFSAVSNFIGFGVGLFIFFVVLAIFMMLSLDGSLNRMSAALGVVIALFAVLLTPALLLTGKRILLAVLKIQSGKAAWLYALASSVLIVVVALGLPLLLGYFIYR